MPPPLDGVVDEGVRGRSRRASRIATVVNIARAVEELKAADVWTVGLAGDAPERYDRRGLTLPTALVLGRKGPACGGWSGSAATGWSSIPMYGAVDEPERLGGRGSDIAVRGGTAEAVASRGSIVKARPLACTPWHAAVLQILFCLGWRSSVR